MLSRPNHISYPMLISRILAFLNLDIADEHHDKPKTKQFINKARLKSCTIKFQEGLWVKQQVPGRAPVRELGVGIGGDGDAEDEEKEEDEGYQFEMRPNVARESSSGGGRPTLDSLQARMDLDQANINYI
ncbi:hypothetical protein CFOL_v3_30095 [Cephalotus follicularis]|uniref:Uncharacterized protein n=1 Tax=Cephalotus follicularis TaxID=3775 RepID=A0A1Q3D2Z5_CEPFO|nr:hypothetical protein CFOL_v3_30095 [Cephalotus follicularis]